MSTMKAGIIGLGKMGLLHMGILNNLPKCDVIAVAEENKITVSALKKYVKKVQVYRDYQSMLHEVDLDIIYITTPVFLHKEMILESMKHELNIFVEKPLTMNWGESKKILSKNFDKKTMVGYVRRFYGTYTYAKKIIDNDELGSIQQIDSHLFVSEVMEKSKGWKYQEDQSGGGVLIDLGSHAIDLFHFLFGDFSKVQAFGESIFTNVEDNVLTNIHFTKGYYGNFHLSWSRRGYRLPEFKINIQCDDGDIEVTEKYIKIYSERNTKTLEKGLNIVYPQNLAKKVPINIAGVDFTFEDKHFVDCVRNDLEPIANFKESAKTNFVIDKIYSSINNESVEHIDYGGLL